MIHLFRCTKCKNEFDVMIQPNTPIVSNCPKCDSKADKVFCPSSIKMGETWPQYNQSAGRTFESRGEEDRHFDSLGAVRV